MKKNTWMDIESYKGVVEKICRERMEENVTLCGQTV